MIIKSLIVFSIEAAVACSVVQSGTRNGNAVVVETDNLSQPEGIKGTQSAVFAGGCFWQRVDDARAAMSKRGATILALLFFGCSQERARDLQLGRGAVHEAGVQDVTSEKFHGRLLSASGYDFAQCATCHGSDFSGGKAKKSCLGCHQDGPTACTTCHRGPAGGAHAVHLSGTLLGKKFACSECHVKPASWDAAGHIRDARGKVDARPAEVQFGALAGAAARFDASTGGCAGVTCHGGQPVSWQGGTPVTCGSCHGVPPPSHADDRCAVCHAGAGDVSVGFLKMANRQIGVLVRDDYFCQDRQPKHGAQ